MEKTKLPPLYELPLETVDGVGPKLAEVLAGMAIESVADLLEHYPHRYLDLSTVRKIGKAGVGEEVTVVGEVRDVGRRRAGYNGRTSVLTVTVYDGTGYLAGVWFNQDWVADKLKLGVTAAFSGRVAWRYNQLQMQNPFYDLLDDQANAALNTGRIIPVHPATAKVSSVRLRRVIKNALDRFARASVETVPGVVRDKYNLMSLEDALVNIHFPGDTEALRAARKRLVFDEFFRLELGLALRKRRLSKADAGIRHKVSGRLLESFYDSLPWALTADQLKAIGEIRDDLESANPMNRLLLGEVGSGKTVVAAAAMLMAVESGYQAALMAPTEVLAEQHFFKLREPLEALGLKVALVLGGQGAAERREGRELAAAGEADIVIGTHALIQEKIDFAKLGLVVIDEQHRFGVRQRLELRGKGQGADMLVLTATPIPRTLALTLYGDLDISVLSERPGGRTVAGQITTKYISEGRRGRAYELVRREAASGRRAYIVCPLIDESDKLEVKSVMREAEHLKEEVFPDLRVGLLHGRMVSADKEAAMRAFRSGELDVLISTTVIEVGVDVPEATIMLIEHAERFGLSQLHQLRGRVGRGEHKSYCLLTGDIKTEEAKARVKAIMTISDGFELAEADLEIRGEGQLFGLRQSGLPDLKLAKLAKHANVLEAARKEAFALVETDPTLSKPGHKALKAELRRRFAGSLDYLMSG